MHAFSCTGNRVDNDVVVERDPRKKVDAETEAILQDLIQENLKKYKKRGH